MELSNIVKSIKTHEKNVLVSFRNAATAVKMGNLEKAQEWKEKAQEAQENVEMFERIYQRLTEK